MTPGRYVRLHKGQLICNRHDIQNVASHLHDLARHLTSLIPDETAWEKLTRSRDFAGGFAQRQQFERELDRAVLEALATRGDYARYEALSIEGYSDAQVQSAVHRLWKAGLLDAHAGQPSTLTTKGFRQLQRLAKAETVGA